MLFQKQDFLMLKHLNLECTWGVVQKFQNLPLRKLQDLVSYHQPPEKEYFSVYNFHGKFAKLKSVEENTNTRFFFNKHQRYKHRETQILPKFFDKIDVPMYSVSIF